MRLPGPAEPDDALVRMGLASLEARLFPGLGRAATLGRYVLLEPLSEGGTGTVYAAYDPDLDRKVAIKLVRWDVDVDPGEGQERLVREAQALARLSHPNIVSVFDVGVTEAMASPAGGAPRVFIVMELVRGPTLAAWRASEDRRPREILACYVAAGRALAAAHEAGIVHRDFKPANVMLDERGSIRVLDFGLARATAAPDDGPAANDDEPIESSTPGRLQSPITRHGAVLGTPPYMSPEQHRGEVGDARSDQYAFCVSLFEALCGKRPFLGRNADELRAAKERGLAMAAFPTGVAAHVQAALRRGLSPDPDERHPSMVALLRELGRDPAARRRRIALVATVTLGLAGALWGAARIASTQSQVCDDGEAARSTWSTERRAATEAAFDRSGLPSAASAFARTDSALSSWLAAWADERREACEATRVRETQSEELMDRRIACLDRRLDEVAALLDTLQSADATAIRSATDATSLLPDLADCRDTETLALRQRLPSDPAARAAIEDAYLVVARAASERAAGHLERSLESADEAVRRARELAYAPLRAEAELARAMVLRLQGEPGPAELATYEAVWAAQAGNDQAVEASAWIELLWVVGGERADFASAARVQRHAEAAVECLRNPQRLTARLAMARTVVALARGDYDRAIVDGQNALARYRGMLGEAPAVASALHNLATAELEAGRTEDAIARLHEALAMSERIHGPSHVEVAASLNNLGNALLEVGRTDEAIAAHRRALEIYQADYGRDHARVAMALTNLGNALLEAGQATDALAFHRQALEIGEGAFPERHPARGLFELNLAGTLLRLDRAREALERYERSQSVFSASIGADHPHTAHALVGRGEALVALGDGAAAREVLERAEAILAREPAEPAELARARFALARAIAAVGGARAEIVATLEAAAGGAAALTDHGELSQEIRSWRAQQGL